MIIEFSEGPELGSEFKSGKPYSIHGLSFRNGIIIVGVCRESDGYPIILEPSGFKIIEPRLPPDWTFTKLSPPNYFRLQPAQFDGNFWDLYHDGDEQAVLIFQRTLESITAFHKDIARK